MQLPQLPPGTMGTVGTEIWDRAWSSSLIGMLIFTCRFTLGTWGTCPVMPDMPTLAWQAVLSGMIGMDGAHAILPGCLRIFGRLWGHLSGSDDPPGMSYKNLEFES